MPPRALAPRLADILEAIEHIREQTTDVTFEMFRDDWRTRWGVERGVEIISEASRHLPDDMKARHPDIPWREVAGIGNVLRHNYAEVAPPLMWALVQRDLEPLERVCIEELANLPPELR